MIALYAMMLGLSRAPLVDKFRVWTPGPGVNLSARPHCTPIGPELLGEVGAHDGCAGPLVVIAGLGRSPLMKRNTHGLEVAGRCPVGAHHGRDLRPAATGGRREPLRC